MKVKDKIKIIKINIDTEMDITVIMISIPILITTHIIKIIFIIKIMFIHHYIQITIININLHHDKPIIINVHTMAINKKDIIQIETIRDKNINLILINIHYYNINHKHSPSPI